MSYKSTRLLVEAVNREMDGVRKAAMGNMALGSLNELRDLVAELVKKAERVAVEDVRELDPVEYVATMKPLVAEYHRILMARDLLAPCLCQDLRANAVVVILVGNDTSVVRTAHDPERPDAAVVVEAMLASLDAAARQAANAGTEQLAGAAPLGAAALGAAVLPLARGEWSQYIFRDGPCEGAHDGVNEAPCGAADCYVLEKYKREHAERVREIDERTPHMGGNPDEDYPERIR